MGNYMVLTTAKILGTIIEECCGICNSKKAAVKAFHKSIVWERQNGYFADDNIFASFYRQPFKFINDYHIYIENDKDEWYEIKITKYNDCDF